MKKPTPEQMRTMRTEWPELAPEDRRMMQTAATVGLQLLTQLGAQGAGPEAAWLVLALAARAMERGVVESARHDGNLARYGQAQEQLRRLLAVSDAASDMADREMARMDGAAEPQSDRLIAEARADEIRKGMMQS